MTCTQSNDFGQCMRDTFLPGAAVTEEAIAEVEAVTPEADQPEPTAPTETADIVPPSFGLVRVEPDGSAVIAGSATPNGEVQLYVDEEMIGSETAEASGDWVFVTDEPLPTGGVELRVLDAETDTYATTSILVIVQDDLSSEPLVVASEPGEASEILQGVDSPTAEDAESPLVVADAPEAETSEPASDTVEAPAEDAPATQAPDAQPTDGSDATSATQDETASETQLAQADEPQAGADEAAEPATAANVSEAPAEEPATEGQAVGDALEAPLAPESEDAASEPVTSAPETDEPQEAEPPFTPLIIPVEPQTAQDDATGGETDVALATPDATPDQEPTTTAAVAVPPSIDAIEIDGDRNFFAGSGTEGATVRLYVENEYVDDSVVADGRWLVESDNVLDEPNQRVRIDMLGEDGTVTARAEVNFLLELPQDEPVVAEAPEAAEQEPVLADEPPLVVAERDEPAPQQQPAPTPEATPAPAAAPAPATEPGPATEPAPVPSPAAQDEPAPTPVEPQPEPSTPASPAAQPSPSIEPVPEPAQPPAVAQEAAPEAPATQSAPQSETPVAAPPPAVEEPQAPVEPETPAPTAPAQTPAPTAEPEPEPSTDIPTLVGVQDGDRTVAGRAIIRRGDNLWTIARRVYGEGMRYTQIYDANLDQIRDPDLIYPGQVFDLPETDMVIGGGEEASPQ